MEAGDIITQPREIIEFASVYSSDTEIDEPNENIRLLKQIIEQYVSKNFTDWFNDKKDELTSEIINYSSLHNNNTELFKNNFITEYYEEFVFYLFRDFYKTKKTRLVFSIEAFVEFWLEFSRYKKSTSDCRSVEITSTEDSWNCIAEWCFDEHLTYEWSDLFESKMMELYWSTIDDNRNCRLACGICWENKTLYTGCFQCNGNYICYCCYFNLENENECPFCRNDGMTIGIECLPILEDNDFRFWKAKMDFVLSVLNKNN